VIRLDAATVLLQWATGGLVFLWVTTRHRTVGIGYGWLLRGTYLLLAAVGMLVSLRAGTIGGREVGLAAVVLAALVALVVSIQRRKAGVSGQRADHDRRTAQVAAMTGIARAGLSEPDPGSESSEQLAGLSERSESERDGAVATERGVKGEKRSSGTEQLAGLPSEARMSATSGSEKRSSRAEQLAGLPSEARMSATSGSEQRSSRAEQLAGLPSEARMSATSGSEQRSSSSSTEFPPVLDLIAPILGVIGLVFAGAAAGGNPVLAIARTLAGAAFLGAVSDAMLLGHWYLVQPGLPRKHITELVTWLVRVWPIEVALFLIPTGMISVFTGSVDDGWNGMLGWMWLACAVLTIGLCFVTKAALKEKEYSAVMAATGLLYLAILTAFGTDLVARAVLAG
jgi:hypothetical protein